MKTTTARGETGVGTPSEAPFSSSTHAFFGNSPITLLARTFGATVMGGSPTVEADHALSTRHTSRQGGQLTSTRTPDTASISNATPTTTPATAAAAAAAASLSSFASPPRPRRSLSAASSCSCSHSSCSEWCCSSWTPSESSVSLLRSPNTFGLCLTAPGPDGAYNPHAPLPSLERCYGNAWTYGCFNDVPSTSTARTESRSSTPFSSEWSFGTDGTGTSHTPLPPQGLEPATAAAAATPHTPSRRRGGRRTASAEGTKRRTASPGDHSHLSGGASPTAVTQLSFATEMDAIEKGHVAPYVSYLFSPEARVVDLRQLEGQLRRRDPAPAVSATCIRFCRAGDAYLVGTSSGLLWRVPVGGAQEAVRATPLGSLWPPQAQPFHAPAASGADGAGGDAARARGTASATPASSPPPTLQPVPLSGHTAAILSIAFNDDGSLYATTGLDGCVIVWKANTSAKLRRISAAGGPHDGSAPRAPHLVRFMPQNNNYLLVSYLESGELHLYNSSTGLPVTNVAGTGLTRMSVSGGGTLSGASGSKHHSKTSSSGVGRGGNTKGGGGGAITALSVDLIASPFFVSGDADGTVVLWTYRAGDVVTWPTLRATAPPSQSGAGGARHARSRSHVADPLTGASRAASSVADGFFATPLYQLPELRRVTAFALPSEAGGVAAVNVTTLHAAQLHSLLRPCGSSQQQQTAADTGDSAGGAARVLPNPLEATAQVLHSAALLNRACREALEVRRSVEEAADDIARRSRRDNHAKRDDALGTTGHAHGGGSSSGGGGGGGGFPHVLAALPSRLSDTFSALWGGVSGGGGGGSNTATSPAASVRKDGGRAAAAASSTGSPTATAKEGSVAVLSEAEMLKQVRSDALDVVCPLLVLVSTPCDTVYTLGLLLQLQHGNSHHSSGGAVGAAASGGGSGGGAAAAKPAVSYRLYPLLKTMGPSRMRHVGVGAVASPDNHRLVVVAAPCEEGFVRVLPLLRLDPAPVAKADVTGGNGGAAAPSGTALRAGVSEATRVNKQHVLATLPMPYGGRCTGLAWSPSGRFLVAITAEGVIYQWSRVYLLNTAAHAHYGGAASAGPVPTKQHNSSSSGGDGGGVPSRQAGPAGAGSANLTVKGQQRGAGGTQADVGGGSAAAAAAAAIVAARRRGCDTEYSDTVNQPPSTLTFTSLLSTSVALPSSATVAAAIARESDAARAAFSEEDAWRQSLQRELERQRREQAALKLVTQPGAGDENEVSSSGYWLDEGANSKVSRNTFGDDEETEQDGTASYDA